MSYTYVLKRRSKEVCAPATVFTLAPSPLWR